MEGLSSSWVSHKVVQKGNFSDVGLCAGLYLIVALCPAIPLGIGHYYY
jgi:hypothetical protein